MKPWLETWRLNEDGHVANERGEEITWCHPMVTVYGEMKFIAASPEMCRTLLSVEWCGQPNGWCPKCHMLTSHLDDCPIDNALTKAGLSDQESRDAAREAMRK
jgi:hypothetical protein